VKRVKKRIDIKCRLERKNATSVSEAASLRAEIETSLECNDNVLVNFAGVEKITEDFLHELFGKLYESFTPETLKQRVSTSGLKRENSILLNKVLDASRGLTDIAREARYQELYKYVNKRVETSLGTGTLWCVHTGHIGVVLDEDISRVAFIDDPLLVRGV
jgi:hypothetical protein